MKLTFELPARCATLAPGVPSARSVEFHVDVAHAVQAAVTELRYVIARPPAASP